MIRLMVEIQDDKTEIKLPEEDGTIVIYPQSELPDQLAEASTAVFVKGSIPVAVGVGGVSIREIKEDFDSLVLIQTPWEIQPEYLAGKLIETWEAGGLSVAKLFSEKTPANQAKALTEYTGKLLTIFKTFGFSNVLPKKKPAKAQHRWNKEVSKVTFYIDYSDAKGEAVWQKRNELMLKKGAKLKSEVPLNKDGSVGYSARLTEKLRDDSADKIRDFVTTDDIIFKSVNELGIFLYYAGTNGWLVLKDEEGRTIDDYTVVKV